MAFIDEYEGDEVANVGDVVGRRGTNSVGDVILVQALLEMNTHWSGRGSDWASRPIIVNGMYSSDVDRLIEDYQGFVRNWGRFYYWVSKDGRIASYKKGVRLLHKQQWTIISLNSGLLAAALGFKSPVDYITTKFPQVAIHLRPLFL
jgi:hypothetical protein